MPAKPMTLGQQWLVLFFYALGFTIILEGVALIAYRMWR